MFFPLSEINLCVATCCDLCLPLRDIENKDQREPKCDLDSSSACAIQVGSYHADRSPSKAAVCRCFRLQHDQMGRVTKQILSPNSAVYGATGNPVNGSRARQPYSLSKQDLGDSYVVSKHRSSIYVHCLLHEMGDDRVSSFAVTERSTLLQDQPCANSTLSAASTVSMCRSSRAPAAFSLIAVNIYRSHFWN
jgi:hypothetical protein